MLLLMKKEATRKMESSGGNRHIRTHLLVDMDRNRASGGSSQSDFVNSNSGSCSSNSGQSGSTSRNQISNDNHCDGIWNPCSTSSGTGSRRDPSRRNGGISMGNASPKSSSCSSDNNNRSGASSSSNRRPAPPFIQISGPKQMMHDNNEYCGGGGGSSGNGRPKSGSVSPSMMPVSGRQGGCVSPGLRNRKSPLLQKMDSRIEQVHEDCFIIPAHRMGTFLPVSLHQFDSEQNMGALSMMQVDDPKLYIVLHFAEPTSVLTLQMTALRSSLCRVRNAGIASEGMLLMNMERNATYPFIVYVVVNTAQTPPSSFLQSYNSIIMDELTPDKLSNSIGSNYISGYEEVATIVRPPIDMGPKTPTNPKTAYLITIFKVFPGEDREKLERSWLLWTGARMIYKHLPQCLGLRRITFHKKLWADGGITYVLLCECSMLLDHITVACGFVEQLRARCCGYTALYKCTDKF